MTNPKKNEDILSSIKIDKTAFTVSSLKDDISDERAYWHSRTPQERLQQTELLRRINYGDKATARLQRVFEVDTLKINKKAAG